jgi:hypothetical protein
MTTVSYTWHVDDAEHTLRLVHVPGTKGKPFPFGRKGSHRPIEIAASYLAMTPVTQARWLHVMGGNPSLNPNPLCPVENMSWEQVTGPGGFLEQLNASDILAAVDRRRHGLRFDFPLRLSGSMPRESTLDTQSRACRAAARTPRRLACFRPRSLFPKSHAYL